MSNQFMYSSYRAIARYSTETDLSVQPVHANQISYCYRDLMLVSRDGMNLILIKINQLLMEKYLKLQDTVRIQVRGRTAGIILVSSFR
eukprot:g37824.t1